VSSIVAMVSAVRNGRARRLSAVSLIELFMCNFHRKSSNVFMCSIFVMVFLDRSSGRKSFTFPFLHVLSKFYLQNSTYSIYFISLHCYYARSNSIKWTLQC